MNKDILNIVVTGGPCGGKTTVLDELSTLLREYGYTVYLVDETATELINCGIKPYGDYKLDIRDFQSLIFDAQLAKENIRRHAASICQNKVAILYDRGIMDNRGYISDEIFEEFIRNRQMTESEILTRYDLVIHLVTAAKGKEEFYTLLNNTARTETIQEARMQDQKTMEAWRNHPNLRIVGNDTLFDGKVQKVKNFIRAYIGEKEVIRQERFLIDIKDIDLNSFNHAMIKEDIEEFVLDYDDNTIELYAKSTINGSSYYTLQRKRNETKTCRIISEEEYLQRRSMVRGQVMHKVRYNFIDDSERFRLDIFNLENQSYAILERDVVSEKRKILPSFIKNATNITSDRNYDDDSIFIDYNINQIYQKRKSTN